ncbi:hypothetical protein [Hyphomicrobium sp.]|uniref:hypothetical protein n=1 Tax=Hyphomicrobium sp. TaxID=82 RepID=UPI002E317FA7|nr:hypothetical protein [Hyphomicrobium sp.]HEX2840811.1 hypothetical protein [Hyphomicrobium sp.]
MKIAALAVSAALLGVLSISPASAVPSSSAIKHATAQDGGVTQVQYKYKGQRAYRKGYRQGYRSGRHYRHAPPGWRRYSARPYGWRTRGCIVIGPVWYCP